MNKSNYSTILDFGHSKLRLGVFNKKLENIYSTSKNIIEKKNNEEYSKTIKLGFIGQLDVDIKGLDLLLPAFERFIKDYPEYSLTLAGNYKKRKARCNSTSRSKK